MVYAQTQKSPKRRCFLGAGCEQSLIEGRFPMEIKTNIRHLIICGYQILRYLILVLISIGNLPFDMTHSFEVFEEVSGTFVSSERGVHN